MARAPSDPRPSVAPDDRHEQANAGASSDRPSALKPRGSTGSCREPDEAARNTVPPARQPIRVGKRAGRDVLLYPCIAEGCGRVTELPGYECRECYWERRWMDAGCV